MLTGDFDNHPAAFPRAAHYAALRARPHGRVREARAGEHDFPYTERHLQCVWYDAGHRPDSLRTLDGEQVRILSPGHWNLEAGPDFLDAALQVEPGGRRVRGDVEVHVRPADWHAHGHAEDPAYGRVVAHVTWFPDRLTAGVPAGTLQLALRDTLAAEPRFSFEGIDVTAYPYAAPASLPAPCQQILATWDPGDRGLLLDAAGEERLRVKTRRLAAAIEAWGLEQAFYEELMSGFGYKHNRVPFRKLARTVTWEYLRDEAAGDARAAYAVLLGVSGLLPSAPAARWDQATRSFVRGTWDIWWKRRSRWETEVMPRTAWRLAGLRPQNHPVRRLAAAALLLTRSPPLCTALTALDPADGPAWFASAAALLKQLPVDNGSEVGTYWASRLSFGRPPQPRPVAFLGAPRIAAILTNVALPMLAATGQPVRTLLPCVPAEQDNALIRRTAHHLFGRDHNPALYHHGLRQQGLLQIFHDFCLGNHTQCRDCTLVPALEAFRRG